MRETKPVLTTEVAHHTMGLPVWPKGDYDHLSAGWKGHYWERLKKYLG
jgi:hypothetical protein